VVPTQSTLSGITLTPQRAQVRVRLDCSSEGKTITAVDASTITLGPLAVAGTMDPKTEDVPTLTAPSAMSFTWPALNATVVTSGSLTVLPRSASATDPLTLLIAKDAITLNGVTEQEAAIITLPSVALEAGKSYALVVKMRKPPCWAASNIYWDGTKLTFAPYGDPCVNNENYYEGLHFKWGSLWGVAPVFGSFYYGTPPPVYQYRNNKWEKNTSPGPWTGIYTAPPTGSIDTGQDNLAGYDPTSAGSMGYGDICRFIGEHGGPTGYRMPTMLDLSSGLPAITNTVVPWGADTDAINWYYYGTGTKVTDSNESDDGKRLIGLTIGYYVTNYGSTFPGSGYRHYENGTMTTNYHYSSGYWTSSATAHLVNTGATTGAMVIFLPYIGVCAYSSDRSYGYPVRCLLDQ
jgi:hypothetical protein